MTHIPGHHGRGMETSGPIVKPGEGYQERIALPSDLERRDYLTQVAALVQRTTKRLMAEREAGIDAGLVHQTPAMAEALAAVSPGPDLGTKKSAF